MMNLDAFRSEPQARALVERIHALVQEPVSLMEVCGTHTVAISRYGLRSLMPSGLKLLSGPGCPVCVTPVADIDCAAAAARDPRVILATFGDMMRVPGSRSSLEKERAEGHDVRMVYSPLEALDVAAANPGREVVLVGVGFETTSPTIAATIIEADRRGIGNFSVLPLFKLVPPALDMLARVPARRLDGFICPGHVSAVIGADAYEPIAREHGIPCVVVGFEPLDILAGIVMLLEEVRGIRTHGAKASVQTEYCRAVTRTGNKAAQRLLDRVFNVCDSEWRGIGVIPASGYEMNERTERFDARRRIACDAGAGGGERATLDVDTSNEPAAAAGCVCGDIMLGLALPTGCPLFAGRCTPRDPVGPCMVSSEGACAAFFKYEASAGGREVATRGSEAAPAAGHGERRRR
jgi:hydrogenase expression/formation protein HypD